MVFECKGPVMCCQRKNPIITNVWNPSLCWGISVKQWPAWVTLVGANVLAPKHATMHASSTVIIMSNKSYCGIYILLVTPCLLPLNCFGLWLVAWWNQAITWTNADWYSLRPCGIHLWALSQEMLKISISKMHFKVTNLRLQPDHPGAKELST